MFIVNITNGMINQNTNINIFYGIVNYNQTYMIIVFLF